MRGAGRLLACRKSRNGLSNCSFVLQSAGIALRHPPGLRVRDGSLVPHGLPRKHEESLSKTAIEDKRLSIDVIDESQKGWCYACTVIAESQGERKLQRRYEMSEPGGAPGRIQYRDRKEPARQGYWGPLR
jgi:hypothetical protein